MNNKNNQLPAKTGNKAVNRFLDQANSLAVISKQKDAGRLIFALDATASRQPTWDQACELQSEMFLSTTDLGQLAVQLCFYRGHAEFSFSPWFTDSVALLKKMNSVFCLGGITQIARVIRHAIKQKQSGEVSAVVFIGDCVEESPPLLYELAGQLALYGVPIFIFYEGNDPAAQAVFREIAAITHGACCPFDSNSPQQLRELLQAVAVYAVGGLDAVDRLLSRDSAARRLLTTQLRSKKSS